MPYARVAVARSGSGFTVSTNTAVLAANVDFAAATSGSVTATHFGIGTDSSGTGKLLFFGPITPNIVISNGVTPRLTTGTTVTEAASDGMGNTFANDLLLLIFNNTNAANIGDATGLRGSSTAGSLYLSLHSSSPAEAGNQSTNELSYS